ncbi:MAG: DnaJ family domain-containing protein [Acidimicrobiales bacterium]
MDIVQSIADRRIAEARAAGLFDGLAGAGQPIPDLDQVLPPGWWATRLIETERRRDEADRRRRH